jgi:outer membrane protein assembly factor BamB
VTAVDGATGDRVWSFRAGADINSSPAVFRGVLYIGSSDHRLYALDATTGARLCSFDTGGVISSSPVAVDTAAGVVVYVGDNGIGGSNDGGHVWAINGVDPNAAGDCSLKWSFEDFGSPPGSQPNAGMWSPPAYAVDRNGRALLIAGSSSPDNAAYAFDALTGQVVWRFQPQFFFADGDVGAGPTISPPGVNGFADGVAYIIPKTGILYAVNLTTGAKLWEFSIRADAPVSNGPTRSTPALVDDRLYLGYGSGVYGPATFPITAQGTATDSGGANPGIARVNVVITNIEHGEYYCGSSGCPGTPGVFWRTRYTTLQATLAQPNASSTAWSLTFSVMDHAHKYSISAWATDRDGEVDPTKVRVSPICIRDPGVRSCI